MSCAYRTSLQSACSGSKFFQRHGWPKLLAFAVAAAIIWPLGRVLNQRKQKELFDPKSGIGGIKISEGRSITRHTFMFIPMEYWACIFAVMGIVCLFVTEES
jgi:hypothetical protein